MKVVKIKVIYIYGIIIFWEMWFYLVGVWPDSRGGVILLVPPLLLLHPYRPKISSVEPGHSGTVRASGIYSAFSSYHSGVPHGGGRGNSSLHSDMCVTSQILGIISRSGFEFPCCVLLFG